MNTRTTGITLLTSLACAVAAYSQTSTTSGAIRGNVKSKKGVVVTDAKLILRNAETGFTRTVSADAKGGFVFSYLPVGNYEITAMAAGLKTVKNGNLRVSLGETAIQNFLLDSAEAAAVVEVVAEGANVDSAQINTATAITQELVEAVPINGRNFTDLVQLTPGATAGGTNAYRTVVEGARGVYNNLQIDGASYNSKFNAENRGGTRVPYSFGQDSIRELQIISNAFDAQYGDASGAVINAVTKSGTNEVQGMAMWLLRPSSLIANVRPVPYDPDGKVNALAARTRDFSQSQYAFNVGGPIIKDKLHYFVNAEYMKYSQKSLPTVALNAASDSRDAFNTFYGVRTDGTPSGTPGMGNILITHPSGRSIYEESQLPWYNEFHNLTFFGRLDWTVNPNHRMTLRLNNQNYKGDNDTWNRSVKNNEAESNNNAYEIKNTSVVLELTSLLTSNLMNEARVQWSTEDRPVTPNSTISTAIGLPGFYTGQYSNAPARTKENLTQFIDNMSFMAGDWMFKGGVDLQFIDMTNDYLAARGGSWYFGNYASANNWWTNNSAVGDTAEYTQGWSRLNGRVDFSEKLFGGYLQAQYSGFFSKRLTLSLGVRYTREMWEDNPSTNPALQNLDHMPDSGSLDPRFGFTLDLFGNSKTVIRGGYGVFSTSNPGQNAASAITNNGVNTRTYKATFALNPSLFQAGGLLNRDFTGRIVNNSIKPLTADQLATLPTSTIQAGIIDPQARMAQSKVVTLGVERDMGHGLVLGIRGTYKRFYNTQYWIDINMAQVNPATGLTDGAIYNDGYAYRNNAFRTSGRPGAAIVRGRTLDLTGFGGVYLSKYDGEGRYKALILEANRRSDNGFGFKSSLTFSKAEDNNSNERSTQGSLDANPIDPSNPYRMSTSDNDVPFRALLTGYAPKIYGFKFSGTFTYSKGYAYSAKYTNDTNGDGLKNDVVESMGWRNGQRQPCRKSLNVRLSRNFRIAKTLGLEGIIDVYNALNWANQTTSYTAYYTNASSTVPNSNFGLINTNDDRTREVQFTLKARF